MNRSQHNHVHSPKSMETPAKDDLIGWREWVALPELKIPAIKAKIDTGAKTSVLHAFKIEPFEKDRHLYIRFWLHPLQKRTDIEIICESPVIDERNVKDSGGHTENRYVIKTPVVIGKRQWEIELTLTSREDMLFRMLLGRTAIVAGNLRVDPSASFLYGRKPKKTYASVNRKIFREKP